MGFHAVFGAYIVDCEWDSLRCLGMDGMLLMLRNDHEMTRPGKRLPKNELERSTILY